MEAAVDKSVPAAGLNTAPKLQTNDLPIRRIGYLILFLTFGLFGTWAVLAPLDSAALGQGVVTVKSYRKTVQHLEGGIVKALYVRDGDVVQADDVLIELDGTQTFSEQEMVRSQLIAVRATENRLVAERDNREAVSFALTPEGDDPRVTEAQENERRIFMARRSSRLGEIDVLQKRKVQLEQQIRGFQDVIVSKQELARSYQSEIGDLNELLKEGFVDKQRLLEQERKLDMLKAEVADHQSEITKTRLQISETELQILQLNKDFRAEVVNQLAEVQTRVFDLQERMAALQDRITRSIINAPESGMILGMTVHTIGGVVSPATPLLDIVPSVTDLIVEAQVSPIDIDRVHVGKPADIRFSSFNSSTTPVIKGEVIHVSADRLINEETGMPYYLARVVLTSEGVAALGSLKLQPGMPAEVLINTGERTMLQYLMQPATDAIARSMIED